MSIAPTRVLSSIEAELARVEDLESRLERVEGELRQRRAGLAIVLSSGGLDHALAALTLATTSASMGQDAHLFCSFWGVAALRRPEPTQSSKAGWIDRILRFLLPRGVDRLALSTMGWAGVGTAMMRARMAQKGIAGCGELLAMAAASGVRISACETTMDLMGLGPDDLVDYPGLSVCGAATFLDTAQRSAVSLFI